MGVGHEKLNYGDTNIFTHSHTPTRIHKQTLGQTDKTAVDSFYFIRLLIWNNFRLSSGIG